MNPEYCVSVNRTISLTHSNGLPIMPFDAQSQQKPTHGISRRFTYQVTDSGDEIATINETRLTFDLGGRSYTVHRKGILGPEYQLKSGDTIIAAASQKP